MEAICMGRGFTGYLPPPQLQQQQQQQQQHQQQHQQHTYKSDIPPTPRSDSGSSTPPPSARRLDALAIDEYQQQQQFLRKHQQGQQEQQELQQQQQQQLLLQQQQQQQQQHHQQQQQQHSRYSHADVFSSSKPLPARPASTSDLISGGVHENSRSSISSSGSSAMFNRQSQPPLGLADLQPLPSRSSIASFTTPSHSSSSSTNGGHSYRCDSPDLCGAHDL